MFKRIKPISKASLEGIVYQIRYLTGEKMLLMKHLFGICKGSYPKKEFLSTIFLLPNHGNGRREYDYFFPLLPLLFGGGVFVV